MKKIILALAVIAFIFSFCAFGWNDEKRQVEGSGKRITEQREVDGFSRLEVSRAVRVTLVQAEQEALKITLCLMSGQRCPADA